MLKESIKALLPNFLLNIAVDFRDRLRFRFTPRKDFVSHHLRTTASIHLSDFFTDPDITNAWEKDHSAISQHFGRDDTFGGVNPGDRRAIYFLIMALKPRNVLEIGTHIGASTIYIASAAKRLGEERRVTTVDIVDVNHPEHGAWKTVGMGKSPSAFASELGLLDQIHFHRGPCQLFMRETNLHFDFIFLDGDHSAIAVYQEVSSALSILTEGGIILLHDYYPNGEPLYPDNLTIGGPFHAMARVQRENPSISVLPLGALPWPTKQGKSVTTLALVVKRP